MDLLVIAPRFPWPLEKGDKLRLYQQLRHLQAYHTLHLFAITHEDTPPSSLAQLRPFCQTMTIVRIPPWRLAWNLLVGSLRGLPLSVAYFTDRKAGKKFIETYQERKPDLVYGQLARVGEYLRMVPAPRVIDMMDAFSTITAQQSGVASLILRPLLRREWKSLSQYERRIRSWTEMQIFISHRDRELIDPAQTWDALIVPNGIDLSYYQPARATRKEFDIVFVGNMGYFPNVEAAKFLVRSIMPLLWAQKPDARVLLAGARPSRQVRALAENRVTVSGWMADIRQAYSRGKVFVAPLFQGAGQQNKILEAMGMGIPVVTTPWVHQSVPAPDGKAMVLAGTARDFAQVILTLLEDDLMCDRISAHALSFLRDNYSWPESVSRMNDHAFLPLNRPTTHAPTPH
ncbi:MAG: glycosyltransferase [Saprospiraceae bacterium]|nr:glycosyltransferase [Saprospiraceae bacterium]